MNTPKKYPAVLAFCIAFIFQPVLSSGGKKSSCIHENHQHEVSVILKLVQVYVVDKDGNPVIDLTQEDFQIFQDGQKMEIEAFEKHILPAFRKKTAGEQKEVSPEESAPSLLNRKFFILIDYYRNDAGGIWESKKAAIHFVKKNLQRGDEAAVMSYSQMGGFNIHCFFTKDRNKILSVLSGLKKLPEEIDWDFIQVRPMRPYDDSGMGSVPMYRHEEPKTHMDAARALSFAEGLRKLLKSMSLVPGNKNIIFFSQGVPRQLMRNSEYATQMVETFTDMSRELADVGAPVFTVNSSSGRNTMKSINERGDDSLQLMSKFSGGKYFEKAAYAEEISEGIQKITGNYYVLGYTIEEKWDGRYHEIEVKVKPKDYTVYSQGGYYNPKPFSKLTAYERQLQLIELVMSPDPYFHEPLSLSLEALPVVFRGESLMAVLFHVPDKSSGTDFKGKTDFAAVVFDEKNTIVWSMQETLDLSHDMEMQATAYFTAGVDPGEHACRVVFRDAETGRSAVASDRVEVPEGTARGLKASAPLYLVPEKAGKYIQFTLEKSKRPEGETFSLKDVYPFLSDRHIPLLDTLEQNVSTLLAIVRVETEGAVEPNIEITSAVENEETGKDFPLETAVISAEEKNGAGIAFLEIALPQLDPGEYTLTMNLEDKNTGTRRSFVKKITIG